jgi:hypothetical protein
MRMGASCLPTFLGGGATLGRTLGMASNMATFAGGRMVFSVAPARAGGFAAAAFLVDGSPCPALGFFLGNAAIFVPLLDMFGLALLFARVTTLVSAWHGNLLLDEAWLKDTE